VAWKWDFFRFFFLNYHHPGEICKLFWFIKIFSIGWRNLNNHLSILYVDLVFQFFLNFFHPSQKMIFLSGPGCCIIFVLKEFKVLTWQRSCGGFLRDLGFIHLLVPNFGILDSFQKYFQIFRKMFFQFPIFRKNEMNETIVIFFD